MPQVILALGANIDGVAEGRATGPVKTLGLAVAALETAGVEITEVSSVYRSPAVGPGYQPAFYNAVLSGQTSMGPDRLLRLLKKLERDAGRRGGLYWGPRPLDVDIIDYGGRVRNWQPAGSRAGRKRYGAEKLSPLAYPHKRAHLRAFVLKPLAEILPRWRHPILQMSAARLMALNCSPMAVRATEKLEISPELWQK